MMKIFKKIAMKDIKHRLADLVLVLATRVAHVEDDDFDEILNESKWQQKLLKRLLSCLLPFCRQNEMW